MNTIPDYYRLYSKVLRATLEELRTRGWTRGVLEDRDGHVCAVGAMHRVIGRLDVFLQLGDYTSNRLALGLECYLTPLIEELFPDRAAVGMNVHPLITFNDHHATVQEDVETLLEKGAIRAEEAL